MHDQGKIKSYCTIPRSQKSSTEMSANNGQYSEFSTYSEDLIPHLFKSEFRPHTYIYIFGHLAETLI